MAKQNITKQEITVMENRFEDIMDHIGWFGMFTNRLYAIMYLCVMIGALNIGGAVFLAANVPYHCTVDPQVKKFVTEKCNMTWTEAQTQLTLPVDKNKTSTCTRFTTLSLHNYNCSYWTSNGSRPTTPISSSEKCTDWTYNNSTFYSTIVSEFDLVCENKWKENFSQLLLMIGILFGAVFCGIGSDKWGRRTCFIVSLVTLFVFSSATSFIKTFWLFAFVRMMVGVGAIGLCISGVVYSMEITSVRHRVIVSQTLQASFSFAFMLLALFAYLERRWIYLNLIISVPLAGLIPLYIWFSGESPRWLLSENLPNKAMQTLQRMARVNNKRLSDIMVPLQNCSDIAVKDDKSPSMDVDDHNVKIHKPMHTTIDLFRNLTLRKISLVLFYNWFAATCIYYGLTLNTASLSGNVFLNFFLVGLVEIPANFGAIFFIQVWGRRPVICTCNIICGISLLSMFFVPQDYTSVMVALFLIGKFGATATFSCIYLYSGELYPTPLRGNGLGICSGFSRLGGVASQLVIMLSHINHRLPFVVFGLIAAVAGILIIILPETRGRSLPETISDTEHLHNNREITLIKQFVPAVVRKNF